jgi:hypothetical protein
MEKVVISGSASLQEELKKWVRYWEKRNAEILAWPVLVSEERFEKEYPRVHSDFYRAIAASDILFVANEPKNGIGGYVGPSVFAEVSFAIGLNFVRKRKIGITFLNPPADDSPSSEALRLWIGYGWAEILECQTDSER